MCNIDNKEALIVVAENENAANAVNTTEKEVRYDIYWDRSGKEIYRKQNKEDKDRTFIVKTTDTRNRIYSPYLSKDSKMCALVQNISNKAAKAAEDLMRAEKITPDNPDIVEIVNMDILFQMLKVVRNDTGEGGVNESNNKEYGGIFNKDDDEIAKILEGRVGDPGTDPYAFIEFTTTYNTRCTFHSHPSGDVGDEKILEKSSNTISRGGSYNWWQQPPSSVDTQDISTTNYVFSMKKNEKRVYVYDKNGILAYFPQSVISGFYEKKQKTEREDLKEQQKKEKDNPDNQTDEKKKALNLKHKEENAHLKEQQKKENSTIPIP